MRDSKQKVAPFTPTALPRVSWAGDAPDGAAAVRARVADPAPGRPQVDAPEDAAASWKVRVDRGVGGGQGFEAGRVWRAAGAALARSARDHLDVVGAADGPAPDLEVEVPADTGAQQVADLVLGLALGSYRFRVTTKPAPRPLGAVQVWARGRAGDTQTQAAVRRALVLAQATALARDLANTPSDTKSPHWLASHAAALLSAVPGVTVEVRDEKWLAAQGFGGVLAVGGGSSRPPRLVHATWDPAGAVGGHLVLVGKGITFDTGGISIKPADGMHLMKTDMAGGAAVLAALRAIATLGLPVKVSALVPCAENLVSGTAYRPGDVVTHHGGTTSEVTNTDAEGRMVLADALAYAAATLEPAVLVDAATLTGAMKVALGMRTGAVFATSDDLAARLCGSGAAAGERWWRLPLDDSYAEAVRSQLADVRQAPAGPGAVTAALFLREFTGGLPWVHLDIAGPARAEVEYDEVVPVASGFAARTLVEFAARCAAVGAGAAGA